MVVAAVAVAAAQVAGPAVVLLAHPALVDPARQAHRLPNPQAAHRHAVPAAEVLADLALAVRAQVAPAAVVVVDAAERPPKLPLPSSRMAKSSPAMSWE